MVFTSKVHKNINLLSVYVSFDLGENIHTWAKVSLVILVLVQNTGTESFTHWLILIGSDSLCRKGMQELERTPA